MAGCGAWQDGAVREDLQAAGQEVGISLDTGELGRLETLVGLWQRYGRVNRLTADLSTESLVAHVQEGMAAVACAREGAPEGGPWLDVGSGGGFPGLVAAALWDGEVVMVEPRGRRCDFLELARAQIGAPGPVLRARWERSTWNGDGVDELVARDKMAWNVCSARAVWEPDVWRENALIMAPGALVIRHDGVSPAPWPGWCRAAERRCGRWTVIGERFLGQNG